MVKKNEQLQLLNDVIVRQLLNGCLIDFHPIKTFACKLHRMAVEGINFHEYTLPQVFSVFSFALLFLMCWLSYHSLKEAISKLNCSWHWRIWTHANWLLCLNSHSRTECLIFRNWSSPIKSPFLTCLSSYWFLFFLPHFYGGKYKHNLLSQPFISYNGFLQDIIHRCNKKHTIFY